MIQSQALCAKISAGRFKAVAADLLRNALDILRSGRLIENQRSLLDEEDRTFISYWFRTEHAYELFALSIAIERIVGWPEWPIFVTLFSSLIISRGSGASLAMDLSRSRPHRVDNKVPKSPFSAWSQKVIAFHRYYEGHVNAFDADLMVGDARNLQLADESVDAVITLTCPPRSGPPAMGGRGQTEGDWDGTQASQAGRDCRQAAAG